MIELDWLNTFLYTLDITLIHQILRNMVLCFGILTLLFNLPNSQFLFGRQIPLYSFDGKNHLMNVKWANEQATVDDRTNVELTVVLPNMIDLISTEADTTQPVTGLENSLKVDALAEKNYSCFRIGTCIIFSHT
ncbi:hypothetical protein [Candidatus Nitrosocosmicus sp. R]